MIKNDDNVWKSFEEVVKNRKNLDYESILLVNDMNNNLDKLGCNMSIKLHYLHAHITSFLRISVP